MEIKLQGVRNIRDFSEYGLEGYIRSAHLHDMTENDANILRTQFDLKTVIDLRTTEEKNNLPDNIIKNVAYQHIPLFDEARIGISHEKNSQITRTALPDMPSLYRSIVTNSVPVSQIKKVIDIINDSKRQGAILWHCTEGKDRCGIISALFLLSRGCDKDTVIQDYLKTNETAEARANQYYDMMLKKSGNALTAEKIRDIFLAKREYIEPIMEILISLSL